MWEALFSSASSGLISHLIRIVTLVLGGLGTIYIPEKQFGWKISTKGRHWISTAAMLLYSYIVTVIYHQAPPAQMLWETLIFWLIANVVYVSVGYNLYVRVDHFLDRKFGKDTSSCTCDNKGDD